MHTCVSAFRTSFSCLTFDGIEWNARRFVTVEWCCCCCVRNEMKRCNQFNFQITIAKKGESTVRGWYNGFSQAENDDNNIRMSRVRVCMCEKDSRHLQICLWFSLTCVPWLESHILQNNKIYHFTIVCRIEQWTQFLCGEWMRVVCLCGLQTAINVVI